MQQLRAYRHWWLDPGNFVTFVTLPLFVGGTIVGGPLMADQFKSFNFLTRTMIYLGVLSLGLLAVGAKLGSAAVARTTDRGACFDPYRFDRFLVLLLAVSLGSHLLMLGSLLLEPSLVLSVLRGEGGMYAARGTMARLVGLTSLTNVTPVFFCLCSIRYVMRGSFFPSRKTALVALLLLPLIFVRAFVGAERLIVIEDGLAFMLPLFSFAGRFRRAGIFAPFAGIAAVLIIFVAGEYMRSWVYYQTTGRFDSFAQFVGLRLLAYLAVASNSGAGMILTMPPVGYPFITARWLAKLPVVGFGHTGYAKQYIAEYGNPEFNNPSGIFAPIVDFGPTIGIIYLFAWGLVLGTLYGYYRRRHPVGLLAYPLFFIGLADLTQLWYWGESRFVPQLICIAAAVALTIRRASFATRP